MNVALRSFFNRLRRRMARALLYRIVFGEQSQGRMLAHTRISPSTCIEHEQNLHLADHVFIGPFNFLEASGGITIEEGVQITSHCALVTHSSHRAMRLMGREYAQRDDIPPARRPGWIAAPIHIGAWSFIGPHTVIEAGTRLGKGTIVRAGSVVRGHHPDFAVLDGRPAQQVGDSRKGDEPLLREHPEIRAAYAAWAEAPSSPP